MLWFLRLRRKKPQHRIRMGWHPLNRCHLFCVLLAHGKNCTQPRATALQWGLWFFRRSRKNHKPHQNGECEGTWFPHAPASDTHWGWHHPSDAVHRALAGEFEGRQFLKTTPPSNCSHSRERKRAAHVSKRIFPFRKHILSAPSRSRLVCLPHF